MPTMTRRWVPPRKPSVHAEQALLGAILDGTHPPGSTLPGERDLAKRIGVTRPTLRETLRRLERDGWVTVRHGKPTRVNDFWREGGLNVLSALVRHPEHLPAEFVLRLLEVRLVMAPAYARAAVERDSRSLVAHLARRTALDDRPDMYPDYDWNLHHILTTSSGNPVYTLILNGFTGFYQEMARAYFAIPASRASSRKFYRRLLDAARRKDGAEAERVTRAVMRHSIDLWKAASQSGPPARSK